MAKPSKIESSETDYVTYWTGAKATNVYTKIDAIIDDYASISEGVDADTLEGSTKAEVQTHAPAEHGNEAHSEEYITAGDVPSGSGARGRDGVGFVSGMLTLWDKTLADVPDGFEEASELTGTNFTIIKFVGGENLTNLTHSVKITTDTDIDVAVSDSNETAIIEFTGSTTPLHASIANPADKGMVITVTNGTVGVVNYTIIASTENLDLAYFVGSIAASGEPVFAFTLPVACNITITVTPAA